MGRMTEHGPEIRFTGDELWERIERAVERVRDRLERVTRALDTAGVPYAVIGGNAVQLWVAQVDESVVRNTKDVDIVLRRDDLERATEALAASGFRYEEVSGVSMFMDGPDAGVRDAVHVVFAGELVRADDPDAVPQINDCTRIRDMWTLPFEDLVRMKLISYRLKDRVHLLDMLEVGLIDGTWPGRFDAPLRDRLQRIVDDPRG